jgi:hypothetical protein
MEYFPIMFAIDRAKLATSLHRHHGHHHHGPAGAA